MKIALMLVASNAFETFDSRTIPVKHADWEGQRERDRGVEEARGGVFEWVSSGFKIPGFTRNRVTKRVSAPFAACEGIKNT